MFICFLFDFLFEHKNTKYHALKQKKVIIFFVFTTYLVISQKFYSKNMEITGKIIAALEPKGGVSARTGNEWKSQEFVIETHDQYPKKCVFRVFGTDRLAAMNIQSGEELTVSFDIDAHEFNGRWFNDVSAWKVERVQAGQPVSAAPQSAVVPGAVPPPPADAPNAPFPPMDAAGQDNGGDDLPF
jgi:hypothetical protein